MKQGGFILAITLWIIVAIILAATFFSERVMRSVQAAKKAEDHSAALLNISNTKSELLFRLATVPNTIYGLGEGANSVRLDGRLYSSHDSHLEVQDMGGLINATFFPNPVLIDLLQLMGLDNLKIAKLIDVLQDYQDADSLRRLNGAEAAEYLEAGLPPPPNHSLRSIEELKNMIAWRDLDPVLLARIMNSISLGKEVRINFNTAPLDVLRIIDGMDEPKAHRLIAQREIEPLRSIEAVAAMTGRAADFVMLMRYGIVSTSAVRVNQFAKSLPWVLHYDIVLTPKSENSPWIIEYSYKIPKKEWPDHDIPLPELLLQPAPVSPTDFLSGNGGGVRSR
jgi:general secretion pathway protein K